ncbi:F0F1 ATP synthase subunit delta [Methylogaea oryzae]|uniref:ATP synthase subunit b n=1 Tax=Methylogaea oryzae TaxID=1295382 RepID=A0A8D4VTL2_9GAMM|nr:F0F1 ATP synthase subunit delta [Methylogaea oryzae]BBL72372.1 ATP synthase subunit b [Methylogaea oryzae]
MELDWSTIALEIVNFLILVWLLKRLLYKPVQDIIAQRRAAIEATLREADDKQAQAQALRTQYENRLAEWDKEKQAARETLRQEIEAERQKQMAALKDALAAELEKTRSVEERQRAETLQRLEESAVAQGARFCAKLLERLTGPDLHGRLLELLVAELEQLPEKRRAELRNGWRGQAPTVEVVSAYTLSDGQCARLQQSLDQLAGAPCRLTHREDDTLLAGVRLSAPPWHLDVNLGDELQHFAEFTHDGH